MASDTRFYREGAKPNELNDTNWCGNSTASLYLTSGNFSSVIKTSIDVSAINGQPFGSCFDGKNTPWCGTALGDEKLYIQSGQFASAIKASLAVGAIDTTPGGIFFNGTHTIWCGIEAGKLYLQSGQLTSTLKDSFGAADLVPSGCSWDGVGKNVIYCGDAGDVVVANVGFTSTILTFALLATVDGGISGAGWDGQNGIHCGYLGDKLYMTQGHFSSTILTSQDISAQDTGPFDASTNDIPAMRGLLKRGGASMSTLMAPKKRRRRRGR